MNVPDGYEPWCYLLGRPPLDEYLGFLVQAQGTEHVDLPAAAERWNAAAAELDRLTQVEAGLADGAIVEALSSSEQAIATQFLADPAAANAYLMAPSSVSIVDLEKLVVFQPQINLRYAEELEMQVDAAVRGGTLTSFCLAFEQPQLSVSASQVAPNQFVFTSPSTDLRFLVARLLDASQVGGSIGVQGRPCNTVALQVGYGVNALNVLQCNGRLILNNGSHRAYALMKAGVTKVPAVVQQVTRPDQLSMAPVVQQNSQLYLNSPRPPMLRDYFAPALHEVVFAPNRVRQVRVQFGVEVLDAPA